MRKNVDHPPPATPQRGGAPQRQMQRTRSCSARGRAPGQPAGPNRPHPPLPRSPAPCGFISDSFPGHIPITSEKAGSLTLPGNSRNLRGPWRSLATPHCGALFFFFLNKDNDILELQMLRRGVVMETASAQPGPLSQLINLQSGPERRPGA